MKNLTSVFSHVYQAPSNINVDIAASHAAASTGAGAGFTATAIDLDRQEDADEQVIYASRERQREVEGEVDIDVVRVSRRKSESESEGAEDKREMMTVLTLSTLTVPYTSFAIPLSSSSSSSHQTISLSYLPEDRAICLITSSGEIGLIRVEEDGSSYAAADSKSLDIPIEIVGSVPSGLKTAIWSPDNELLVLLTGDDQLLVMTRYFDVVYESPLRVMEFGDEAQINVGWGSKKTQFHGSLGKTAAQVDEKKEVVENRPRGSPGDDGLPRISWRGDGQYFAVSSLDPYSSSSSAESTARRQIRVYARDPSISLSTTSEPIYGLEPALAWRPSGNLIACTQKFGPKGQGLAEGEGADRGRRDVVFLERNGLQHGEFGLREGAEGGKSGAWGDSLIMDMQWSCDSEVLAVWIRSEKGSDIVQLWTMNNYHYYLKQELRPPVSTSTSDSTLNQRFTSIQWHPERAHTIYLTGPSFVQIRSFSPEVATSLLSMPHDTGSVAVVDGSQLLITPFRSQNTPPPMSSYQIQLKDTPVHVAFSGEEDKLAVLYAEGYYQIWNLQTAIRKSGARGGGEVARPVVCSEGTFTTNSSHGSFEFRQIALGLGDVVACLAKDVTYSGRDVVVMTSSEDDKDAQGTLLIPASGRLVAYLRSFLVITESGQIIDTATANADADANTTPFSADLPTFAFDVKTTSASGLILALDATNKLHVASDDGMFGFTVLANNCNSFIVSDSYLIWTTTTHVSKYAPIHAVKEIANGVENISRDWQTRKVERGSQIVTVVPSAMTLILQMPRGNLETISPRPLVLEVVKRDVLSRRYRSAFLACRRHRIDLNVLFDLDAETFMDQIEDFVKQIPEVDYLNLFVSGLSDKNVVHDLYGGVDLKVESAASVTDFPNKINRVCDAIREELQKVGLVRYVETILTTHVCKSPPDLEAGLKTLLQLKSTNPEVVEDAIKYIIFLTDVNKLYDVALGMYDFQLVLMVAQYSQKDPKEYLPFLRELRALDKYYQRFRIDDYLERRPSALRNLKQAGPDRFDEALRYIEMHGLYAEGIDIYKQDAPEHLRSIYEIYAGHLFSQEEYYRSALAFMLASSPDRAMAAYERAKAWRELFTLAISEKIEEDEMEDLCSRVAERLALDNQQLEAAQILLDYRNDVDEAVRLLCRGSQFAEAERVIAKYNRTDLIEIHLHAGLEDAAEQADESLDEFEGQLDKEMQRLEQLVQKMEVETDSFFMIEQDQSNANGNLDNVDVMTEATTAITAFTRFTVGATTIGGTSFGGGRSEGGKSHSTATGRRKARKKVAGRKGTVDEFDYLLASLKRLATRIEGKFSEIESLLPHLLLASPTTTLRETGRELEEKTTSLSKHVATSIDLAWSYKQRVDDKRMSLITAEMQTVLGGLIEDRVGSASGVVMGMMRDRLLAAERERLNFGLVIPTESTAPASPKSDLVKPVWKGWRGGLSLF